jgi:dsDNA-specific endonuclease/ATPase MutS2
LRALLTLALHGHALQQRGEWLNGPCQGRQHANRTQAACEQDTGSMRQVVNWIDGTSGTAHAFDFPLRYKLQARLAAPARARAQTRSRSL